MTITGLDASALTQRVQVSAGMARLQETGGTREFGVNELPEEFVRWQLDYKHSIYDAIERDEYIAFNAGPPAGSGHLGRDSLVPNLANKGVGFHAQGRAHRATTWHRWSRRWRESRNCPACRERNA